MNPQRLLQHFDRIAEAPDAVARLRRFILDLAVRGKLVEQDPNDEPASELLMRIAAEKARLVKAGEIREKPWPSAVVGEEIPFAIPTGWRWSKFANLADFSAGRTPSRNDPSFWNSGEHAWVSIADMDDGQVVIDTKETVSDKARERVFRTKPQLPGTVLMSFKLTIGKIARLGIPAFHNEAIISIRPFLGDLDGYLFKVLPGFARQGDTKGAIKGATLNRDSISNILLPLPPLAEQHRIVAKVDELMALCDRLEAAQTKREQRRDRLVAASLSRINQPAPSAEGETATAFRDHARFHLDHLPRLTTRPEHIKSLRQTILNLAVHGCLVPQHPNDEPAAEQLRRISEQRDKSSKRHKMRQMEKPHLWPDKEAQQLPTGWSWMNLGEVALSMRYGTSVKCNYDDSGVPVLRIPNVSSGKITLEDLKYGPLKSTDASELSLNVGDLLLIRSNGSIHIVGRAAVVTADAAEMSFAGYLVRLRLNNREISPNYVWTVLNSTEIRGQIEEPIRSAVGLKNVNLTEFGALSFRLPPLAEQHRIVAKVDKLMDICDQLEAQLTITQTDSRRLLDGLLHEALA